MGDTQPPRVTLTGDPYNRMRRSDLLRNTPAELAIREALIAVEAVGADVRLTDAVILLGEARERLADYIDGVRPDSTLNARYEAGREATARLVADHIQAMVEGLSGTSIGKAILREALK